MKSLNPSASFLKFILFLSFVVSFSSCIDPHGDDDEEAPVIKTEIRFHTYDVSIPLGETFKITYTIIPSKEITDLVWKSSDEAVATVSQDGTVNALSPGGAVISLTSQKENITVQCNVIVNAPILQSIRFPDSVVVAYIGEPLKLDLLYNPANAIDKTILWKSSNPGIAETDQTGTITAKKNGYVFIEADHNNNVYDAVTLIPATRSQVAAASYINSVTWDQKYFINVFVGGISRRVTINEIKLYSTSGSTFEPGEEVKTVNIPRLVEAGKAGEIATMQVSYEEFNKLTFGTLVRLDIIVGDKSYYMFINWMNQVKTVEK